MDQGKLNTIYDSYSALGYQAFRRDLVASIQDNIVGGVEFPKFPSADLQRHLQGNANEIAIRGALAFRDYCVATASSVAHPITAESVLLDFGSGWGRIARAFMSDVPAANIFAVEPFDFIVEARKANPFISFVKSEPKPPLPFRNDWATHIVTWSTFSHFNNEYFDMWLAELGRVLKPGGLCFISTLGVHFVRELQRTARSLDTSSPPHFWIELILKRLHGRDIESIIESIQSGEFFWLPSSNVARDEFAECFVTSAYIEKKHGGLFEVAAYASAGELAQDCIALKKR